MSHHPEHDQAVTQHRRRLPFARWAVTAMLAIVLVPTIYALLQDTQAFDPRRVVSTPVVPSDPAKPQPGQPGPATVKLAKEEARTLTVAALDQAATIADAALKLLAEIEPELRRWNALTAGLLTSDEGRLLAAHPDFVDTFHELHAADQPNQRHVDTHRSRVLLLIKPVREALANPESTYRPAPELLEALRTEETTVKDLLADARSRDETIQHMLVRAQGGVPSTLNLQQAIDKANQDRALARARVIADKVSEAERIATEQVAVMVAKAHGERILQAGRDEANRIQAESARQAAEARRQRANAEADTTASQAAAEATRRLAETEQLRKRAEDPTIQALYAPFLSKGRYVMGTSPARKYEIPRPVSFGGLVQRGVLSSASSFARAGAGGGHPWCWNDRPKWSPVLTEEDLQRYEGLLTQFKELAPIWMEMGLLQK